MTNKELIEKYPFLQPYNLWDDEPISNSDYSFTMLDEMPFGWRESFGEQLCEELRMVLIKEGLLEKYRVHQIKEKFGSLRWYGNFENDSIAKILEKYEEKSKYTCIRCGAPATKISLGWISPYCDNCVNSKSKYEEIKTFWKNF